MAKLNNTMTISSAQNSEKVLSRNNFSFREKLLTNKWLNFLEIIAVFTPVILVILLARSISLENPFFLIMAVWIANVVMLVLVGVSIKIRGDSWKSIGLNFKQPSFSEIGWTVLKSIPIFVFAIVGFIFGAIVMANIVGIPEGADMTKYNYLSGNLPMLLISLLGAYFVASFGEEVVYRGFLITRLQELFGDNGRSAILAALFLSSVIFGFAHFEWGATGIVQTTFMGLAFGIAFLVTKRSLWPLIIAHGYMDTILFVQLYLAP